MGHSMGGHGALTLGLRHPEQFKSLSALAPVVAPSRVPWGQKAFSTYLGPDRSRWGQYDACELIAGGRHPNAILIDQGDADEYLDKQLCTNLFEEAARQADQSLRLRMQPGYDHSYYFIATFMEDHIHHHATLLGCR
jgi:S-formylglutathione hydrolase